MSILDFPRVHFKGVARVNVPTANRNINNTLDIATNTVLQNGAAFDLKQHPSKCHEYLKSFEPKFNAQGQEDKAGQFNHVTGYNMIGNNHFSWENTFVTSVQLKHGCYQTDDPLVGSKLTLWGHYNEYLRTSFNRARWVDNDPTRRDSALIYAGQLTISDGDASANTAHILSSDIDCTHGVRWLNPGYIVNKPKHFMQDEMAEARLFQFSVSKDNENFIFNQLNIDSAFLEQLKITLEDPEVLGLTVQYCISNLSPPSQPDTPVFCDLQGTISVWRKQDMATSPTGRILQPDDASQFSPIAVKIKGNWVSFNMPISIPYQSYAEALPVQSGMPPKLTHKAALGDLILKSDSGKTLAVLPESVYQQGNNSTGVFDVPLLVNDVQLETQSLSLQSNQHNWHETDWHIQAEQHIIAIESANPKSDYKSTQAIDVFSYFRGKPHPINKLIPNITTPKNLRCDVYIETDKSGRGQLNIESLAPGSGELFLGEHHSPVQVRILSDDWALLDVADENVDYDFLYHNVMGYYELLYPFMADKVFSMADKCKCETYARLMWQMCDPKNRDKSYYMPSTREMSSVKSHLFLKYLSNVEQSAMPKELPPLEPQFYAQGSIKNKEQLITKLRDAVDLELSIMLQYLYSAYSLPTYAAGEQYVKSKRWTQAQLELVNGSKERRKNSGWRGAILEIAHEEMIHYLVINNILMSLGESFYPGEPVFAQAAKEKFGLDTEFSFEPFSEHIIAKFVRFEWPHFFPSVGKSIADFYNEIRIAITEIPDLYTQDMNKQGGEHHLFLNEIINRAYPNYQFEVYDKETALFAIDFVTEQGEGASADSPQFEHSHFNRLRSISKNLTLSDIPFEPAYPVLKNPVISQRAGCNVVTNPNARALMTLYQGCHELMFKMMMQHFAQTSKGSMRRSRLMNAAIDLMTGILRPLSVHIMTLPSGTAGRNAGPPLPQAIQFKATSNYEKGCLALAQACKELAETAKDIKVTPPETQIELLEFYQKQMTELATNKLSREG
ncbi:iminophenyl-pyruvate dimer synthase VioB [Pseudoalteromonas sp. C2R02]|uniref:iminophenyl-pyruvate dimer synthase VioB n=1 Tax=Pseudoalteromonas sp. C2R02 TaxID=2841565 RepID=UPI001C08E50A|nr:iminophenyl-pyruvate dimer synthase VioB [Pseudoalteromonas sp. C2R02]MBU2971624.1 iminophenyl-pyruvate dimer synthase VioB [Pseudoalteromonas sp. C2R02]